MNIAVDIVLSFVKRTWYVWVMLILSIFLVGSCAKNQLLTNELKTMGNNYEDAMRKSSRITQEYNLNDKDYNKQLESALEDVRWLKDSLKALNISPRKTNKVQTYSSTRTVRDTIVRIFWKEIAGLRYNEISKEGCGFTLKGGWFDGDSTANITVTTKTELAFINYWERNKLWNIKFLPKWGKRKFTSIVINKCLQDSIINNQTFNRIK